MAIRFDGKTALVTGGAMGIGAATARKLCELGASVAILDRNVDALERFAAELRNDGYRVLAVACDIAKQESVSEAIDKTVREFGSLHVIVSNAGIQRYGDISHTSPQVWDEIFDVHVKGCFHVTRFGIPAMLASGGGSIVIVGSVQSMSAVVKSAAYVAAKHALLGITRSIALDYALQNIRANCVCPGTIDTPMMRWSAEQSGAAEALLDTCRRMHPLGRIGTPEEVANAIVFLASDWASFITGTTLLVDGGLATPAGGMGLQGSGLGTTEEDR